MLSFNPTSFELHIRTLVANPDPGVDLELDKIDDAIQTATPNSDDARACAYIAADVLAEANRPWCLAYALNSAVAASCMAGDTERARRYLKQLVDLTIEKGTDAAALSAAENVRRMLPGNAKPDHVPNILYEVVRLYEHLGRHEEAIQNLITVAHLFADFGAFQPAYHSLGEAEDLARDNRLLRPYADTVSAAFAICLLEGDHEHAERVWPTLKQKYVELREPVPVHLAANRATLLLQTGKLPEARTAFEEVLSSRVPSDEFRARVLINLSACLRELGDFTLSNEQMADARQLIARLGQVDPELPLEAELIAAKTAIARHDFAEAVLCLNRAVQSLDAGINLVEKLHYRRGLRERYVPRIESLLAALPSFGRAADLIPLIAATRSNRVSDWMYFLEWAAVLAAKLPPSEREELDRLVDRLAEHGSPHLFGYLEKYDDPMSAIRKPDPWRDIAEYADKACARYGVSRPFEGATSNRIAATIAQRLEQGYALLVNLLTADHKMLLLIGDRYVLCQLPRTETRAFIEELLRHRQEPGRSKAFALVLDAYQAALLKSLAPVVSELAADICRGVIFVPDRIDATPINLVLVGDPKLRARMALGEFDIHTCIAPYPASSQIASLKSCLGVVESQSGLKYDRRDVDLFFTGVGVNGTLLEDPEWDVFAEHMAESDALVLSHHGASVGLFTDPYFADMAGPHRSSVMRVASLQAATFRWPHRLVVLGTCHSGGLVNGNFQTRFSTHDLIGFPTLFLLNGRSEVVAASWAILDRFNLLFTALFAPLLQVARPSLAASIALARLYELSANEDELRNLLLRAFPDDVPRTPDFVAQMATLCRQPFCYGAYQTFTLL